jgi:hypothetical protein
MMFGRKKKPTVTEELRETLFGDMSLDDWSFGGGATFPWSAFENARADLKAGRTADAIARWRSILQEPGLETRVYLQAWHFLREVGESPAQLQATQVLGVVVEVAMPEGLDLLAAYDDHTARYYNYSGAGVVWEHPDDSMDGQIDALIAAATDVVRQIGPWEGERPAAPPRHQIRLSFLTPGGLHFGQGPFDAISADPMGGPVVEAAMLLMSDLMQRAQSS